MKQKWKIGDAAAAAVILLAAAMLWFFWRPGGEAQSAVLNVMGEKTTLSLQGLSGESVFHTIEGKNGIVVTLEMQDHAVRVCDSECPDKVCVKTGWVSHGGSVVVCAPAEVIVHLQGENDLDGVTG